MRARGFSLPAAGKTGTSHDGWFAGFTSNLLAVVWVGYDDDRDLNLTGAQSALPLWTEFMKRTTGLPVYKTSQPFSQPDGIETAAIDNLTNLVALADPALTHSEVFIAGTEPFPPVQDLPAGIALGPDSQPQPTRDSTWGEATLLCGGTRSSRSPTRRDTKSTSILAPYSSPPGTFETSASSLSAAPVPLLTWAVSNIDTCGEQDWLEASPSSITLCGGRTVLLGGSWRAGLRREGPRARRKAPRFEIFVSRRLAMPITVLIAEDHQLVRQGVKALMEERRC